MGGIRNVLSIAGTDPSGGAGIQADLKTIGALGGYGMAVVTALVAQSTTGVRAVRPVPADFVLEQMEVVFADIRVDAVKIGMLGGADVVEVVCDSLARHRPPLVVLDPVMAASSGHALLEPEGVTALVERLLPTVDLVIPNLSEAAVLLGQAEATSVDAMVEQARALAEGPGRPRVLLTGGHLASDTITDVFVSGGEIHLLANRRVRTGNDHGTGCTLSSAVAVLRAQVSEWSSAVRQARRYVQGALMAADQLDVGRGRGPLNHFHGGSPPPSALEAGPGET